MISVICNRRIVAALFGDNGSMKSLSGGSFTFAPFDLVEPGELDPGPRKIVMGPFFA